MSNHPITPPPDLVTSLRDSSPYGLWETNAPRERWLIDHAYAAGADQELAAVEEEIIMQGWFANSVHRLAQLHATRRPKPPTMKEQLLQKLEHIRDVADKYQDTQDAIDDLREALEAL